ncbi:MAG TPA: pitrilysin family protein [Candidatus Saccharimonadales bacterium]|nr:pitrilysin family protein [Candidatus Saccharimonadales bacterium]
MRHIVNEVILKNGAKGLLIHIPNASVMTFDFNFRAGEYLVEPDKWEVPHLMEHVVLGANELIPKARDFQAELERNGAYSNATTGVYDITYETECADFEWDRVLGLLLTAITKPLFLDEEFAAEFGNVQEEMAARSNNHFRRLSLEMRRGAGLIAKTDAERLELMDNVKVEDIRQHYARTHTTPNMRFVIAGNLSAARRHAISGLLEAIELPTEGERFRLPHERPRRLAEPIYVPNDTVENLYFYIDTFTRRRLTDPEVDALNLVNTMLTETLYSKILGTARERGLVYSMNSGLSQTRDASNWWFGAQVSDKNALPLMAIIVEELTKVLTGDISAADLKATKQYSLGRFQRGAQTVSGTAAGYASRYFFDNVIDNYYQVPERIRSVTKQRIVDVAAAMFGHNIWGIGVLGDCGGNFVHDLQHELKPLWHEAVELSESEEAHHGTAA